MKRIAKVVTGSIVIGIIGTLCMVSGCGKDEYAAEKALYKARLELKKISEQKEPSQADIDRVVDAFGVVTTKWPLSKKAADAHYEIARLYVIQKKYDEARKQLEKVIMNFSTNAEMAAEARFAIGQIYEQEGDKAKSVVSFKEVYDRYPLTKKGLYAPLYIAETYRRSADTGNMTKAYEEALRHYRGQIEVMGKIKMTALVQNYVALTYASQGLWEQAVTEWAQIPALYPESPLVAPTYLTLGEVYFSRLKERGKAVEQYEKLIEVYPKTAFAPQAMMRLIQMFFVTNAYTDARKWCEQLIAKVPQDKEIQAQARIITARCFEKEGEWEKAEKIYQEILDNYAGTVTALRVPLFMAGHYKDSNKGEADKIFNDALANYENIMNDVAASPLAKQSAFDLTNLIYAQQENWDEVLTNVNLILDDPAADPARKARALFVSGFIYQEKVKDLKKARELYEQFLTLYPKHPMKSSIESQLKKIKEGSA